MEGEEDQTDLLEQIKHELQIRLVPGLRLELYDKDPYGIKLTIIN